MNIAKGMLRVGRGMLSTAVAGLLLLGGWLMVLGQASPVQAIIGVVLVDADAVDPPNGMTWGSAYTNVQDALTAAAINGDEIWVADGIYYPDEGVGQIADSVTATFQLTNEVALYGGFVATETVRSQRNVTNNTTVLSGDLAQDDLDFDPEVDSDSDTGTFSQADHLSGTNAYHVVTGSGTDGTAVLDGFTVTAGLANANGSTPNDRGGGMYNSSGSPSVSHVTFSGNSAFFGGGMNNNSSSPSVSHVTFSGNSASANGGGMYNHNNSSPSVSHVTFSGNSAFGGGGGMYNSNGSPSVSHVTFSGNSASFGGGMYNNSGSPSVSHVTFSDNSASFFGGGMYNNSSSSLTLTNTIIANSTSGGDCINNSSTVTDGGHNLIESAEGSGNACGLTSAPNNNILGSDPDLGRLAENGGSTLTHKPNSGSVAIDAGSGCSGVDQRGATRPWNGTCDIGAVEVIFAISSSCGSGPLSIGDYRFTLDQTVMTITVNTVSSLDCIRVEEIPANHMNATAAIQSGYWWDISGSVSSGFDVDITLPYSGANTDTRVCKWPGGLGGAGWDCGDGSNTMVNGNFVTRSGITGFSDWAAGQGAGPTAVTLQASDIVSNDLSWLVWAGSMLLLLSAGALTAVRRRF